MAFKKNQLIVAVISVAFLLGVGAYYWMNQTPPDPATTFSEEYSLVLSNYEGEKIPISEFKRKILVVHTWASWCPYCDEELRNLVRLKEMHGDQIEILAINRGESLAEAKTFTDPLTLGETMEILLDPDDSFYKEIGGYAMPETLFINNDGDIVFHQRGPIPLSLVNEKVSALLQK